MTRYRLRFLLQEIDLAQGETLIGRSAACHVTIEDPLVSRQHARVRVEDSRATVEDLGSRNGSFVNGRAVSGVVEVRDGDRIRIGTQDLVLCTVGAPARRTGGAGTRPTGFMCHCADCGLPYPAELVQCPSCGSTERLDEDTISGVVGESNRNWTLELLVEVLERAVALERWDDVERMLKRARPNVEERLASGQPVTREQVDGLSNAAVRLAETRREAEWGRWALSLHAALAFVPRTDVMKRLSTLPPAERASLAPVASRILDSVQARGGPQGDDHSGFAGVQSLTEPPAGGDAE